MDPSKMTQDEIVYNLMDEFDDMCKQRHVTGVEKYGANDGFLKNNLFEMIAEEIADVTNYCRYLYVRMRLLDGVFEYASSTHYTNDDETVSEHEIPPSSSSFVGAGGLYELLQKLGRVQDSGQWGKRGSDIPDRGSDNVGGQSGSE